MFQRFMFNYIQLYQRFVIRTPKFSKLSSQNLRLDYLHYLFSDFQRKCGMCMLGVVFFIQPIFDLLTKRF